MAGAPQYPRFQYPQAEYFSLAPNQTISLQGMRRINHGSGPNGIAPGLGTQIGNAIQLESGFQLSSAIYIRKVNLIFLPADGSRELELNGLLLALGFGSGDFGYQLGYPSVTQLTPLISQVVMSDRELLITGRDIQPFATITDTGPLWLNSFVGVVNNDSTNTHNASTTMQIIYSRLDGFTE